MRARVLADLARLLSDVACFWLLLRFVFYVVILLTSYLILPTFSPCYVSVVSAPLQVILHRRLLITLGSLAPILHL
jgi:hypothetical protein